MRTTRALAVVSLVSSALSAPTHAGGLIGSLTFDDATASVGIAGGYYKSMPVDVVLQDVPKFLAGGAVGDFNRDGMPDLFALSGTSAPDRLYINNGDGTFTDRASDWGIDRVHHGIGAVVGDYNNDGYLDMYVLSYGTSHATFRTGQHLLYRNNGDGTFTDVALQAGVRSNGAQLNTTGAAFGDYDLDGDLDLFVCIWDVIGTESEGHRLFRNNGDGTFADVSTSILGLAGTQLRGFAPAFADMNGDRYPELLVTGDFQTSLYAVNNRDGTFTCLSKEQCGLIDDWNAMGAVISDVNEDGHLDWIMSNISQPSPDPVMSIGGQCMYINQNGADAFIDIAPIAGIETGHWGWGTDVADFNNDGLIDIVEVNGWENNPQFTWEARPALLWTNDGDGTFTEVGTQIGFDDRNSGRGVVTLDFDMNGTMDIVTLNHEGPTRLFRNNLVSLNANSIAIDLNTSGEPGLAPDGFGARIVLFDGGNTQHRYVDGAQTFLSVSGLREHFGLGSSSVVDEIRVEWPDGRVTTLSDVAGNRTITLSPASGCAGDCTGDGVIAFDDLVSMLFRFGTYEGRCDADLSGSIGFADLIDTLVKYGPCD